MNLKEKSIFHRIYSEGTLVDRFKKENDEGIDVVIPLINTNELWEKNLYSYYREMPIKRLIIGDAGCTDDSIKVVKKFPRVTIIDHSKYHSSGYCVKKLIEEVKTDWFVYLHADVYLPPDWYDKMVEYQDKYDWYECYSKLITLVEYWAYEQNEAEREYSGSQMGRTEAFKDVLPKIDDDYLQRSEDIVIGSLIKEAGFKYARVPDTFHYHQVMNREGEKEPKFKEVNIIKEPDEEWERKVHDLQVHSVVKYLQPKPYLVRNVNSSLLHLWKLGKFDWAEYKAWVKKTNPVWLKHIRMKGPLKYRVLYFGLKFGSKLYDFMKSSKDI